MTVTTKSESSGRLTSTVVPARVGGGNGVYEKDGATAGLSRSGKIALGVGVGIGLLVAVAGVVLCCFLIIRKG